MRCNLLNAAHIVLTVRVMLFQRQIILMNKDHPSLRGFFISVVYFDISIYCFLARLSLGGMSNVRQQGRMQQSRRVDATLFLLSNFTVSHTKEYSWSSLDLKGMKQQNSAIEGGRADFSSTCWTPLV